MGFFNRVFRKERKQDVQSKEAETSQSSAPKLQANLGGAGLSGYRSRAPRVKIDELTDLSFRFKDLHYSQKLKVANLSVSGVGLMNYQGASLPDPQVIVEGYFQKGSESVALRLKLIHVSARLAGFSFFEPSRTLREFIETHFNVELAGAGMSEINPDMLQKDDLGEPRWYRGQNNCELYYVLAEGKVAHFHFSFFGNYVEGAQGELARFGHVIEDEVSDDSGRMSYKGANLIRWDLSVSQEVRERACRFIKGIEVIDEGRRQVILTSLTEQS